LDHAEVQGATAQLEAAKDGSVAGARAAAGLAESLLLCPIEDREIAERLGIKRPLNLAWYPVQ
jgi:hypothetical protein